MYFFDIFLALFFALVLTVIFPMGLRGYRGVGAFLLFFLLIFLVSWAGGIWIGPPGMAAAGRGWLVFLLVGLIAAWLITALMPPVPPAQRSASVKKEAVAFIGFNLFFWLLITTLLVSIFVRYLVYS